MSQDALPVSPSPSASDTLATVTLQQRGELPVLQVNNAHASAAIALQGAQVLEYRPHDQQPVVWLSEQAEYRRGQSVRGGIPVCWPWFGALERNPDDVRAMVTAGEQPAHGLVRCIDWTLRAVHETAEATEITLGLVSDLHMHQQWPHAAELELQISIGRSLRLQLTTLNLSEHPIALTQALHTYFAISDISAVQALGFENGRYIDTLAEWRDMQQTDAIDFVAETDRIYLDVPRQVVLRDNGWQRDIVIQSSTSRSAVVWNPWVEKAKRLSQFASDAWQRMVCIETAKVLDDQVTIAPHSAFALDLEIAAIPR